MNAFVLTTHTVAIFNTFEAYFRAVYILKALSALEKSIYSAFENRFLQISS